MLRAGSILLTLWAGLNLVIALGILVMILLLGKNAPALMILFGDIQGKDVDPRSLATINALAGLCNAWRAAMSAAVLVIIWTALRRKAAWAFWTLAGCVIFVQLAGLGSGALYHKQENLLAEAVPSLLPIAGLLFATIGMFRGSSADKRPPP